MDNFEQTKEQINKQTGKIKKAWKWIWHSNSILSWIVALLLMFIFVKFIFFPGLSLITGSSLPLAGVESSSMEHVATKYCKQFSSYNECLTYSDNYEICGNSFQTKKSFNFDNYWGECGNWYDTNNITKSEFSDFYFKNGFRKGDIMFVWGRFTPKVGDVIVFKPNKESLAPNPIIHRIVKIENINGQIIISTKGDHNEKQLHLNNNAYRTDETRITQEQVIGKAVFRIPYLGWVKLGFVKLVNLFR